MILSSSLWPMQAAICLTLPCGPLPPDEIGGPILVPRDHPTIQAAINAAENGDEIIVAPGEYTENIQIISKSLRLRSTNPQDAAVVDTTIIDGGATSAALTCLVTGPGMILDGFTITGGDSLEGGGVVCTGGQIKIGNCVFISNHADREGGAIFLRNSIASISRCDFTANVSGNGGAIAALNSQLDVDDCHFLCNIVLSELDPLGAGGAIAALNDSALFCDSSTFVANRGVGFGGGIAVDDSVAVIDDCFFLSNDVTTGGDAGSGGGVSVLNGELDLRCGLFLNNHASSGGAMSLSGMGTATVRDSRFERNSASIRGGATRQTGLICAFSGCEFLGNTAGVSGAMAVDLDSPVQRMCSIYNSTFIGNRATVFSGGAIRARPNAVTRINACTFDSNTSVGDTSTVTGSSGMAVFNSIIRRSVPTAVDDAVNVRTCNIEGGHPGMNVIDSDPQFVRNPHPGPDGLWGTTDDDYGNLRPQSPGAINRGNNDLIPVDTADADRDGIIREFLSVDITGQPRILEGVVDLGAYEVPLPSILQAFAARRR